MNEAMNSRRILIVVGVVIIAGMVAWWLTRYLTVDSCLDRGGRWNYEKSDCEFAEP